MAAALALGAAVAGSGAEASSTRAWSLPSGVRFEMSARELRASREGATLFSTAALLAERKREFDADAEERARELLGDDPPAHPDFEHSASITYRPLSVVGPLVSLLVTGGGYAPGAAHPYAFQSIEVVDVTRPDAKPSLLDHYTERQIVRALEADPWIRWFLDPDRDADGFPTLAALAAALNDGVEAREVDEENPCLHDAYFGAELVRAFAFHHREGGRVAVRIGLSHASEVCRGTMNQVGLLLPIPVALRADLARAAKRAGGFLARDAQGRGAREYSGSWAVDLRDVARRLAPR
jgi:hypothetical protein